MANVDGFNQFIFDLANQDYEYRTIDGSNNNLSHPEWGKAHTQLLRTAPVNYDDGISSPAEANRPNPREVSNEVFQQNGTTKNSKKATGLFWLWGQLIDHDLDLSENNNESLNIPVPAGDPWFDPNNTGTVVIPFHRSQFDPATGTSVSNPRQQLTDITSYLDGSCVYGSSQSRLDYLKGQDGYLKVSQGNLPPFNDGSQPNADATGKALFVCGDVRANENLGLSSLHTLFVREHNFWVKELRDSVSNMGDDECFQRSKVCVEALLQSITYNEFLPLLLGKNAIPEYTGYDDSIDTTISNEFSTAAYRFGHTLVNSLVPRYTNELKSIPQGNLSLRDAFFASFHLCNGGGIEPLLIGYSNILAEEMDHFLINDLRNFLFGPPGAGGLDLASLNIQRGRDHGLATFNQARVAYGLPAITSFSELTSNPVLQTKLQNMYTHPDNLDLWVAGLIEEKYEDSMLGETFTKIIAEQFIKIRDGDRFWYENRLTPSQIEYIKNTKLSYIIRRHTDAYNIPKYCLQNNKLF